MARGLQIMLCALLLVATAACSFTPVYAIKNSGAELPAVEIAPIADRAGQLLHNELQNLLPPTGVPPRYRLEVTLREAKDDFGIRRDLTATFARLTVTAQYRLLDLTKPDTPPATQGTLRAVNSYNILANTYATLVAEEDARAKACQQLARDMQLRLATYFNPQP